MRAFDQSIVARPLGVLQDTDQPGRQIWAGDVFPIQLPSVAPVGTGYFKLDSTLFRIPVLHYDLYVSEEAADSMSQADFNFHVALVLDKGARSEVEDYSNVVPAFWQIWARADRNGNYMYDSRVRPRQNVRYADRFEILQEHIVEVPPQWNFNSQLPQVVSEWDYNNSWWQGVRPWDQTLYQPRPGFPGPWTGEGPDPRTPYIQGDGADMSRTFRWGQETIQLGQPGLPSDSVLQTETKSATPADPDVKYWSGAAFGDNPGLWGCQFDAYPPFALAHGGVPQRPVIQWNNQIGGYITLGHKGSEAADFAQQTHRVVKAREGARCVRTNHATYLNDVDVMIDGQKTNFKSGSIVLDNDRFRQFITTYTPGGGFAPEEITSYDKRLYLTAWTQAEGLTDHIYVPVIDVRIRIEFEPIH